MLYHHLHKVSKLKRRALLETFTAIYALEKQEWIETGQSELWSYKEAGGDILCNIKKQAYFDVDYEKLQNFNIVQSGEEDNAEFSIINPNLLDLDFEDSDSVSNAPAVATIIYNFTSFWTVLQSLVSIKVI